MIEPLSYPLLFMDGEDGWGDEDKEVISFRHYMSHRMLMPEKAIIYDGPDDKIGNYRQQIDSNYDIIINNNFASVLPIH